MRTGNYKKLFFNVFEKFWNSTTAYLAVEQCIYGGSGTFNGSRQMVRDGGHSGLVEKGGKCDDLTFGGKATFELAQVIAHQSEASLTKTQ